MGHAVDHYSLPEVREQDTVWLYSYRYGVAPKHELAVTIGRWGKAELSRLDLTGDGSSK
jgi:hypothetical protein